MQGTGGSVGVVQGRSNGRVDTRITTVGLAYELFKITDESSNGFDQCKLPRAG